MIKTLVPGFNLLLLVLLAACKKSGDTSKVDFTGLWNGKVHHTSWQGGNPYTSTDTTYNASINIIANDDGTISINDTINYNRLHMVNDSNFTFGSVNGLGTHRGAICSFNSTFNKVTYVTGSGSMGGAVKDSFFASR